MKFFAMIIASLVLMTNIAWSEPSVRLLSERHRTEWNWIEYRISVTNTSSESIQNPEVRYFAENSWIQYCKNPQNAAQCASIGSGAYATDSLLKVDVDYANRLNPVHKTVSSVGKITAVKLSFTGALNPGKTLKVNFRIHKKDWSTWSAANDWSYQKNSGVSEPNYFFAVYDSDGNILWGDDPLTGNTNTEVEVWHDRGGNSVVAKYNGDTSEVQKAGRFWMLKDVPMNNKEIGLLKQAGVTRYFASVWRGKNLVLLKSNANVKKKKLDSLVYGFYNSFSVDDTTKLVTGIGPNDWVKKIQVCAPFNSCHNEMISLTSIEMATRCWDDVGMEDCKTIVESCGGTDAVIDNHVISSKNTRQAISCIESKKDVLDLFVLRPGDPDNNTGRKAVNIENLQLATWDFDFRGFNDNVAKTWLKDVKYTGEDIIVGVYDTGIYFDHYGMNAVKKKGGLARRQAYENIGQVENGSGAKDEDDYFHATHVAGIIGGNGNGSRDHMYRGVAPKVKFYSKAGGILDQRGHVVNHSHGRIEKDENDNPIRPLHSREVEEPIFENWKSNFLDDSPKTYVVSAGNDGKKNGFHSITFDTKNGIVVGSYASLTKIPSTYSSMGPTWDGRIKPDVMAPGSGIEKSGFSADLPFEAYLDYLHITHDGEGAPYMAVKFGNNANIVDNSYIREMNTTSLTNVSDVGATGSLALKWVNSSMSSNYVNWWSSAFGVPSINVKNGDLIELRMRLSAKTRNLYALALRGNIYLASGDDFYQEPKTYVQQRYSVNLKDINDEYFTVSFTWNGENISSKFFRLDFDIMNRGIVSSVPCDRISGGTCYDDYSGTSMAAPYVSGIAALMNQAYMEKVGFVSLRNSTSKAILIHTADDMIDEIGIAGSELSDVKAATGKSVRVTYGKGPDFVTGWGGVNAENALKMFESYNDVKKVFNRFREFDVEIGESVGKRFFVNVNNFMERLRLTLTWDDPFGADSKKRLVNDLDMYLVSPTGKYYFPWRLEPLPIKCVNSNQAFEGVCLDNKEYITETDVKQYAVRECSSGSVSDKNCFDNYNNVEVVDVDFPEKGKWTIVIRATSVGEGVGEDKKIQTASIASDLEFDDSPGNVGCEIEHPYQPLSSLSCSYDFGISLTNFVTFSNKTFVGSGDYIQLLDDKDNVIGRYTGNQLAGVRLKIDSSKLTVRLESNNKERNENNYGFSIDKIEMIPYSMLFGISH